MNIELPQPLVRLRDDIDRAMDAGGFWAAREIVVALADGELLSELVNERLEAVRDGNRPRLLTLNGNTVAPLNTDRYQLRLTVMNSAAAWNPVIQDAPSDTISVIIRGRVAYSVYEQPQPEPHDVFDRSRTLRSAGTLRCGPGDSIVVRAGRDVLIADEVHGPSLVVDLKSHESRTTIWSYDRTTLEPLRFNVARRMHGRVEYAARMLGHIGNASSETALETLLEHPAHFVRWNAVRALTRLNAERGVASLRRLLDDPHPDVRTTAERALSKLAVTAGGN